MDSRTIGPDFRPTYLHRVRPFIGYYPNRPFPNAGQGPINEGTYCPFSTPIGLPELVRMMRRGTMKPGRRTSLRCLSIATCMLAWSAHPSATAKAGISPEDAATARRGKEALTQHS